MTHSGQPKKSQALQQEKVESKPAVIEEPPKGKSKSPYDLLIEDLKAKKPEVYEQYRKALQAKKPAWVYPDLTVRIG